VTRPELQDASQHVCTLTATPKHMLGPCYVGRSCCCASHITAICYSLTCASSTRAACPCLQTRDTCNELVRAADGEKVHVAEQLAQYERQQRLKPFPWKTVMAPYAG
jgi:hypothetical protein